MLRLLQNLLLAIAAILLVAFSRCSDGSHGSPSDNYSPAEKQPSPNHRNDGLSNAEFWVSLIVAMLLLAEVVVLFLQNGILSEQGVTMVSQNNFLASQNETLQGQLLESRKANYLQSKSLLNTANSDLLAQIYDCKIRSETPALQPTDRCISGSHPAKRVQALSTYLELSRSLAGQDRSTWLTLHRPDLSRMDLSILDLSGTHMEGADFTKSILVGLDLRTIQGNQLIFAESDLRGAAIGVAEEKNKRNLIGFDFSDAKAEAIQTEQSCKEADCAALIEEANVCKTWFENLMLENSTFARARLSHASFQETSASDVSFRDAQLQCADLRNAKFLKNVDLGNSNLSGAWLYGADLSGAESLEPHQLEQTCGAAVILPDGMDPPIHWKELPWDPLLDEGVPEGCPPGDDLLAKDCLRWQPHRARFLERQGPLSQHKCKQILQRQIPY